MNHKNNLSVGATKALSLLVSVGATKALSLLVSVVTLVRVLFENPRDGELMLALERKVTLHEAKNGRAGDVTFESLDENLMIREFPVVFLHR